MQGSLSTYPTDAKVAVTGSRSFADFPFMRKTLNHYHEKHGISWITSGGAMGADSFAVLWAHEAEIFGYSVYLGQWEKFGRRAGKRRNLLIVENSDIVIAFPTPDSKGTWHTVGLADKLGIPVIIGYSTKHYTNHTLFEMRRVEHG